MKFITIINQCFNKGSISNISSVYNIEPLVGPVKRVSLDVIIYRRRPVDVRNSDNRYNAIVGLLNVDTANLVVLDEQ